MMMTRVRYLAAAGVSAAVFLVYVATLAPATAMWDAGEYIAAAKSLGVPHQPGNPMFVLIAHVAGLIPLSPTYDVRINLLAALASAITAGLWFLCAERLLRERITGLPARIVAAAGAALLGAGAFTVWNQSVVMEKVYPLALLGLALTSWLVLVWLDMQEGRPADRMLTLVAYLVGVTYAIHPAGLLAAPAAGAAVLAKRASLLLRWRLVTILPVAFLVGASSFAVVPIRAAFQPYVNESAVSACEHGTIAAGCTFSKETARRLVGAINREQYGGNAVLERRGPFVAQVQMFWLYFKWQWLRDLGGTMQREQALVASVMLVLGLFGLASLSQRTVAAPRAGARHAAPWIRPEFAYFGVLTASFTIALIYYLNFRYGFSQDMELGNSVAREPRDRDYFYMWTFSLWGLLAGLGLATFTRKRTLPILGLALVPFGLNWKAASRAGQEFTSVWATDALNSAEPNGIIVTNGDNDSFPLWHAQSVLGIRPDVTIALVPYLDMEWYARQLNRRSGIWKLSDAELDSVPYYLQSVQPLRFTHGHIDATIPPGYLMRNQLLVLRSIKDSFPERPVYFMNGGYANELGLGAHMKQVGLLQKLEAVPVRADASTVQIDGRFIDVPKSLALWTSYGGAQQLIREGRVVDRSTLTIPVLYAAVGQDLARALATRGDHARSDEVIALVRRVVEAIQ
jgi:hypothetical protein